MKREEKWYAAKGGMMGKRRANVDIGSYAKSGVRSVFSHDPFANVKYFVRKR